MDELTKRMALDLYGAIPVGKLFGMQFFVDPSMPNDRIRFVYPETRRYHDFPLTRTTC